MNELYLSKHVLEQDAPREREKNQCQLNGEKGLLSSTTREENDKSVSTTIEQHLSKHVLGQRARREREKNEREVNCQGSSSSAAKKIYDKSITVTNEQHLSKHVLGQRARREREKNEREVSGQGSSSSAAKEKYDKSITVTNEQYLSKCVLGQHAQKEREKNDCEVNGQGLLSSAEKEENDKRKITTNEQNLSKYVLGQRARREREKKQRHLNDQCLSSSAAREENVEREAAENVVNYEPTMHHLPNGRMTTYSPELLTLPQSPVVAPSPITSMNQINIDRSPPPLLRVDTSSPMNCISIKIDVRNINCMAEASKDKNIALKQYQGDLRKTDLVQSLQVSNIDLRNRTSNQLSPGRMNTKQAVPEGEPELLPPCSKSKREEVTEGSLSLTTRPKGIIPIRSMTESETSLDVVTPNTKGEAAPLPEKQDKIQSSINIMSSPLVELNEHPTLSSGLEKISTVLDSDRCFNDPAVVHFSLSPHSNIREGEKCDPSQTQLQSLQKILIQSSSICLKSLVSNEVEPQKGGERKQTTTITEIGEQLEGMVSEASTEVYITRNFTLTENAGVFNQPLPFAGDAPVNRLTSQSKLPITLREASMHGLENQKPLCLTKCSSSLEGHSNSGNQCYKAFENGETETVMQAFLVDQSSDEVMVENRTFPFTKSYSVWGNVESLEVFRLMPQHPHFRPLQKVNELLREGQALGYMVSFATLADKVSKAQLDEPNSTFEHILESLIELEANGFNVHRIRARIKKLLTIRDRVVQLDEELKQAEGKMIQKDHEEKESITSLENEMDEKLRDLQEFLTEINKKR
ncbi:hypothetical protein IFM89_012642 [Coptis chinensis]|uniref:Uncharacterized protein n=1 Tax=Coptis chinensis TaxID=261450 RepID=A0A835IK66_9MAGN|nr:hypothetical protein IFM89_012642 [Coptis chinensis]